MYKFHAKSEKAIFLGYSINSRAYQIFNKDSSKVEEFGHIKFINTNPPISVEIDSQIGGEILDMLNDLSLEEVRSEPK